MTSIKIQINYNVPIPYVRDNDLNCFGHFVFDFWNLFDIYNLLFGALFKKIFDFMDKQPLAQVFLPGAVQWEDLCHTCYWRAQVCYPQCKRTRLSPRENIY